MSDAAPASTSRGPSSRHARDPFRTPRRSFTVTGTSTAIAIASMIRHARSCSSRRCAPAPVSRHLLHRAAEVDVDNVRADLLDHARRIGHRLGLGAEQLDRERVFVGRDAQVAERPLVAVLDARATHHLGADETGSVAPSLPTKRLHADTGHRRQHEPRGHLDRADTPGCAQVDHGLRDGTEPLLTSVRRAGYHSRPLSGPVGPALSSLEAFQ